MIKEQVLFLRGDVQNTVVHVSRPKESHMRILSGFKESREDLVRAGYDTE